jgi:hypothetical protein
MTYLTTPQDEPDHTDRGGEGKSNAEEVAAGWGLTEKEVAHLMEWVHSDTSIIVEIDPVTAMNCFYALLFITFRPDIEESAADAFSESLALFGGIVAGMDHDLYLTVQRMIKHVASMGRPTEDN